MQKKITFFILSTSGSPVRQATISRAALVFGGFMIAVMLVALGYGIYDYHHLRIATAGNIELHQKNAGQKEEIKVLRKQIQQFADEINLLKSKLVALNDFEKKVRIIANLEISDNQNAIFGVGGSAPEDLDSRIDLTEKHSGLVREMHGQIEQLNVASALQQKSFESLLKSLDTQRSILASTPAISPVHGLKTSSFGNRVSPFTGHSEFHKGIDIANRVGTPIVAPADGKITNVEENGFLGNAITISHGYGLVTRYGHLQKVLKKEGDTVKRGETIALMGNSGRSTGPHLHYEVMLHGANVNPEKYIVE